MINFIFVFLIFNMTEGENFIEEKKQSSSKIAELRDEYYKYLRLIFKLQIFQNKLIIPGI